MGAVAVAAAVVALTAALPENCCYNTIFIKVAIQLHNYIGPQFAHLANSLLSAYQQACIINTTLQKECEVGSILGPF